CNFNFGMLPNTDFDVFVFTFVLSLYGLTMDGIYTMLDCDPIATGTGEFVMPAMRLLNLGGPLPVEFQIYYGSMIKAGGITTRMGTNWMHNFEWTLSVDSPTQVRITFYGGKQLAFVKSNGLWQSASPTMFGYQLVSTGPTTYQF